MFSFRKYAANTAKVHLKLGANPLISVFCWFIYLYSARFVVFVWPLVFCVKAAATRDIWYACQTALVTSGSIILFAMLPAGCCTYAAKTYADRAGWSAVETSVPPIWRIEFRIVVAVLISCLVLFAVAGISHFCLKLPT